jgi:quercetin dioxygenase-like cupin family protein
MSTICRIVRWTEYYAPNAAMLRFKMVQEGYRVFQWGDLPESTYALHRHEEDQSHWVISGAIEFTVGDESYILEAGDRDFMPANTWHSARVVSEEPVVYLIGEWIGTK